MPPSRRKTVVPSRRRREDDGEEEGSLVGDVEDDSLSEGSAITNGDEDADIEGSDISEEEVEHTAEVTKANGTASKQPEDDKLSSGNGTQPATNGSFKPSAETAAMMNGLTVPEDIKEIEEISFDDITAEGVESSGKISQAQTKVSRQETPAERNRREHQEYLKQRNENPAFVPTRGGFFLHDNRSSVPGLNTFRAPGRGRGRVVLGGMQPGRSTHVPEPMEQPWSHDLHDTVLKTERAVPSPMDNQSPIAAMKPSAALPPATQSTPNRSFSTSTLIGNVSVTIALPGMTKAVSVPNVAKKQHTLLPQHRPPLRRDKPVRISIPDQSPRYIFPATERSFIFIPRAMRPNQQSFTRGRGRGSFHGSRRTSLYGGSNYTPSIAMSRRSSVGGVVGREGLRSPTGSVPTRQPAPQLEAGKPVVRLPPAARQVVSGQPGPFINGPPMTAIIPQQNMPMLNPAMRENRPTTIPMHQPRPQKTVSVADIETPATFTFNPPQQQQEQPFHQQVPPQMQGQSYIEDQTIFNPHIRHPSHPSQPSGTPLAQIPERAIFAQPFQPFPVPQAHGYFAGPYPPGAIFYPSVAAEGPGYSGTIAPTVMAPTFVPSSHHVPFVVGPPPPPVDPASQTGTVAHESNGMVYYYDSSQLQQGPSPGYPPTYSAAPTGGVVGIGGMMTPPGHYYYPQAPNGIFYPGQ